MTPDEPARFDIGHPAPGSATDGALSLWVGFFAAPALWSLQLAAGSAIAGLACLEDTLPTADSEIAWAGWCVEAINMVALALSAAAILFSLYLIRRTREADPKPEGGVMRAGEGRARFMAVWALFSSVLFTFAIGSTPSRFFSGGLCPA